MNLRYVIVGLFLMKDPGLPRDQRKDFRRPRFSFFRCNCQTAGPKNLSLTPEGVNPILQRRVIPGDLAGPNPSEVQLKTRQRPPPVTGSDAVDDRLIGPTHSNRQAGF